MIEPQDTVLPHRAETLSVGDLITSPEGISWSLTRQLSQVNGVHYWSARCEEMREADQPDLFSDDPFASAPASATDDESALSVELSVGLEVELKVVWPRAYSEDPTMWRFQAELELERLASVEHRGIQRVYAWGVDEARACWWIALEAVEGISLARIIESQRLPTVDARKLFLTLARGLDACHQAQVSHRHLDPSYIIISETQAKITRFQLPEEVRAGEIAAATALLKSHGAHHRASDAGEAERDPSPPNVTRLSELPRYDLLPPEWLDGVDGESSADLYCFGACLLRALNPEGVTWRDAPVELQSVIAVTMHLDPEARGDSTQLCALLERASTSYLYQGTDDDTPRRLMLHEIVRLIRADEVAWHMLGYPLPTPNLTPEMSAEDHEVELVAWGSFQEVVDAIELAKRAQPTGERDRSTQKALELLQREEDLNQRERELKRALKRQQLKLKAQAEELEQLRSEAQRTRAETEGLRSRAREEYEVAHEARTLAKAAHAEHESQLSLSQGELKKRYEQLRARALELKTRDEAVRSRSVALESREQSLSALQETLKAKESELEEALTEAQRVSARAKVEASEAATSRAKALQSEEATTAARERLELELAEHESARHAERAEWRARHEELQTKLTDAARDAERARAERTSAERERELSKQMLSEAEEAAHRVLEDRTRVDADIAEVKREREHLKRERSKLLEGQRDLIDQTRRLTFRERSAAQREQAISEEESRVEALSADLDQRLSALKARESRVEAAKHALLRDRQELESERKALERQSANISGSFLALTRGRIARGESGEPLPAAHLNEVEVEGVKLRMRYCPPGRALHGSGASESRLEEQPRHLVEMTRGYWLSETPVTQRLWRAVMGPKEWSVEGDTLPADQLSWLEALDFCNQLSRAFGLSPAYQITWGARPSVRWSEEATGYRLPTEAEWEHAARGGGTHSGDLPGEGALSSLAWYSKNADQQPRPVAQLTANAWQLFDLCGNVWEWCHDEWRREAYRGRVKEESRVVSDPVIHNEQCTPRVVRGGAFYDSSDRCRIAARPGQEIDNGYGVGVRLCLPLL